MRFSTKLALFAAAIVPAALAQSVTIDPVTLTQCATSTVTFEGSSGPYYVAVIPAQDPCTEDAIAEFYEVQGNSVDYAVTSPSGTQVQIYVLDVNGNETWGQIETVGDGDPSCLPGYSSTSVESSTSTSSSSAAPSTYVAPAQLASTTRSSTPYSGSSYNGNTANTDDDTPVNAADNTNGASTLTASVSLLVGAFAAAAALL